MIIKTDMSNISLHSASLPRTAPEIAIPVRDHDNTRMSVKSITERLSIERSLGDALNIAQMSQNVIQKAISISLRLRNIATGAIVTGSINTQALNETLTDIRSTMSAYGEQVPNPVQPAAAPSVKIIEMPDIRNALASVRDIAGDIDKGEYNQNKRLEAAHRNLSELLTDYRISESRITGLMRETTDGFSPPSRFRSGELAGQIKTIIQNNPDSALYAQGNINHTAAERLMA